MTSGPDGDADDPPPPPRPGMPAAGAGRTQGHAANRNAAVASPVLGIVGLVAGIALWTALLRAGVMLD